MIQIYEDDTEMIVNHDPHPNHQNHHGHAYPFHWRGNYTVNNETYLSDTSIIFTALVIACAILKVTWYCVDRYQSQFREHATRAVRQRKIKCNTKVISELEGELLNECSICLENFVVGQRITQLSCHHPFHKDCLNLWIRDNHNCPLCRLSV